MYFWKDNLCTREVGFLCEHIFLPIFYPFLPVFKSFMLAFEQKTLQIHELHDAIIDTIRTFLCYFCEYEKVNKLSPKQLRLFSVEGSVRKRQSMFLVVRTMSTFRVEEKKIMRCSWGLLFCFKGCVHYCCKVHFK